MATLADQLRQKAATLTKERDKVRAEVQVLQQRLRDLNGALAGIDSLLRVEDPSYKPDTDDFTKRLVAVSRSQLEAREGALAAAMRAGVGSLPAGSSARPDSSLLPLLDAILSDGKPRTNAELANKAEEMGFPFKTPFPPRAVNATLMSAMQTGKLPVERTDVGSWQLVPSNR